MADVMKKQRPGNAEGAFSSPEEVMFRKIKETLFPDNCYKNESGGAPDCIVDLTYEQFLDFHKTYYHPSNSYICLYGKLDIQENLKFIDEEYLSHFDYLEVSSQIETQQPFSEVQSFEYPYSVTEEKENQLYVTYNLAIGQATNKKLTTSIGILEYILLDTPASPLKKALIKEGIGEDVFGVFQTHLKQPIFSIVAKNVAPEDENRFYEIIEETLTDLANNGLDADLIEGALQVKEFDLREGDSRGHSKGLNYFIGSLKSWNYDDTPTNQLKYEHILDFIKEQKDNGYFEGLITEYLLNNTHATKVKLYPKKGLDAQTDKAVIDKLADIKANMSQEEIANCIAETKKFKAFQDEPDTEEMRHSIPILKKEDLEIEPMFPRYHTINKEETTYIVAPIFTNQIGYLSFYFDLEGVDPELIQHMASLVGILGKIDTQNYTYEQLSAHGDKYIGGVEFHIQGMSHFHEEDKNKYFFLVKTKALVEYKNEQLGIFNEIMTKTSFADKERIFEILKEMRSLMQMSLQGSGHQVAVCRLLSNFSPLQAFEEKTRGLDFYHFIENIIDNWDSEGDNFISKMEDAYKLLTNSNRITVGVTVDEEEVNAMIDLVDPIVKDFGKSEIVPTTQKFELSSVKEGLIASGNVNYVAMGYNFKALDYHYRGSMLMLKSILSMDYLWNNVRVKNGVLIYNRVRTHILRLFPFINPKSTWKRTQVYQPRVPPSHHPHSTINGQCKAPHGY
ncbi:MAG: hypothetical protein ATN33_00155 [Epulopiscium sp. Nele67-Bin001]|nr:MAG: hypothetical protein ATN33_00155 [Epulopiscium sp. Nele67-Bin001]